MSGSVQIPPHLIFSIADAKRLSSMLLACPLCLVLRQAMCYLQLFRALCSNKLVSPSFPDLFLSLMLFLAPNSTTHRLVSNSFVYFPDFLSNVLNRVELRTETVWLFIMWYLLVS